MDENEAVKHINNVNIELKEAIDEKECWHLPYFFDSKGDVENKQVKEIAHRLNNEILKNVLTQIL